MGNLFAKTLFSLVALSVAMGLLLFVPAGTIQGHSTRPRALKPALQRFLTSVAVTITQCVERAGAGPQGGRAQAAVWVALEHSIEEVLRGALLRQKVVDIVEILAGFDDFAGGGVVKVLVLVTGDDPARVQSRNGVDGLAPGVAASARRLAEVLVDAVVDHVAGDDHAEIGHVEHAALVGVAVTDLDDDEVVTLESEAVVGGNR